MRKFLPVILIATLGLSGCSYVQNSRLNPFNWFGSSQERPLTTQEAATVNPLIPEKSAFAAKDPVDLRQPVAGLESLVVERIPGGAIIRVTGITNSTGAYDVELKSMNGTDEIQGTARYTLVAYEPTPARAGPIQNRRVTAAVRLTNQELERITGIEVLSASNVLTSRR